MQVQSENIPKIVKSHLVNETITEPVAAFHQLFSHM